MLRLPAMPDSESNSRRVLVLDIPWRTLFRLLLAAALVWCVLQLLDTLLVLLVAILLAVTLETVVVWLQARGLPRWAAVAVVALTLIGTVGGFLWMTWSSLVQQSQDVVEQLAGTLAEVSKRLPSGWRHAVNEGSSDLLSAAGGYAITVAQSAGTAVTVSVLGFVLTIYLLLDGSRIRDWFVAFVPLRYRSRVARTLDEGRQVIFAYVVGNVLTSIIATVATFVALWLLGVPAALFLAILAGLSDFVPVIGFVVSAIPALLLALTVSGKVTLAVAAFYVAYNTVESYVLSPWAYGGRLRLSDFAVVLAFVIGAELAGVIGALIALPLAALYPTVERIWLRGQLPEETVEEHRALEAGEEDAEP